MPQLSRKIEMNHFCFSIGQNTNVSNDICNNNLECYKNENNLSKDGNNSNLSEPHSTTLLMRQYTRI